MAHSHQGGRLSSSLDWRPRLRERYPEQVGVHLVLRPGA